MDKSCILPLTTLNLTTGGILPCCASHLPTYFSGIVLVNPKDAKDAWNNPEWKRFRKRIANDDYGVCHSCPIYKQKTESWATADEIAVKYPEVGKFKKGELDDVNPSTLIVSFDERCNLHCLTCRPYTFGKDKTIPSMVDAAREYAKTASKIVIAGDGEIAVSPYYKELLTSYEGKAEITIMTNGTLVNEKFWASIPERVLKENIKAVHVSGDGTTKELFESIRRGADFDKWASNTKLLNEMRLSYGWHTKLIYTVNKRNIDDMHNVTGFAKWLGFRSIHLQPVTEFRRLIYGDEFWYTHHEIMFSQEELADVTDRIKEINESYNG